MKQLLVVLGLILAILITVRLLTYDPTETIIAQARADAIRMQAASESRKDLVTILLPVTVFGVAVMVFGTIIVFCIVVYLDRRGRVEVTYYTQPRVIERQIVYVLQPGQSRRELWQAISQGDGSVLKGGQNDY